MENEIKEYIKSELRKLDNGAEYVKLKGVYFSLLNDLLGGFDLSEMDTNGWQVDYTISNDKYYVNGSMYYGTATIELN